MNEREIAVAAYVSNLVKEIEAKLFDHTNATIDNAKRVSNAIGELKKITLWTENPVLLYYVCLKVDRLEKLTMQLLELIECRLKLRRRNAEEARACAFERVFNTAFGPAIYN